MNIDLEALFDVIQGVSNNAPARIEVFKDTHQSILRVEVMLDDCKPSMSIVLNSVLCENPDALLDAFKPLFENIRQNC